MAPEDCRTNGVGGGIARNPGKSVKGENRHLHESNAPVRFHRFANRLEISNPGGLYGDVSPANFPRQTDYRNPIVAETLKVLGYVNRFGRDVLDAQESLRENGNPPALYTFEPASVTVSAPKSKRF